MVKQEVKFWKYLWKTQLFFLSFPLLLMLLSLLFREGDIGREILRFIVFPCIIFPIIALLNQIGSVQHKELLLTYPINPWVLGAFRPAVISLIYSGLFVLILKNVTSYTKVEVGSAFASSVFYMIMASLFLLVFKNAALGLTLPLAYLFLGMFTTGSGQGQFYLMQWGRPNPNLLIEDTIITQGFTTVVFIFANIYFLKNRNRYHIMT